MARQPVELRQDGNGRLFQQTGVAAHGEGAVDAGLEVQQGPEDQLARSVVGRQAAARGGVDGRRVGCRRGAWASSQGHSQGSREAGEFLDGERGDLAAAEGVGGERGEGQEGGWWRWCCCWSGDVLGVEEVAAEVLLQLGGGEIGREGRWGEGGGAGEVDVAELHDVEDDAGS